MLPYIAGRPSLPLQGNQGKLQGSLHHQHLPPGQPPGMKEWKRIHPRCRVCTRQAVIRMARQTIATLPSCIVFSLASISCNVVRWLLILNNTWCYISYICSASNELGSGSLVNLTIGYRLLHLLRLVQSGHPQVLDWHSRSFSPLVQTARARLPPVPS